MVSGEPGIGKSTLLEAVADRAEGAVTWTRGVEAETTLSHAGLLSLLTPLREHLGAVPAGQSAALGRALGWDDDGGPAAPLLVAAGTSALLSAAATKAPLLVVVDDAHWLDYESTGALLFAARRMRADRVAFLIALRSDTTASRRYDDLPQLRLDGLNAEAVQLRWPTLLPAVAVELTRQARGNPLVLDDTIRRLSPAQRAGAAPLPVPLPTGARLTGWLGHRLVGLSASTQQLVLLHACAGPLEEQLVTTAALDDGVALEMALDEARAARVLVMEAGMTRLAHPMLRTAVLRGARAGDRRAAHASLASAARRHGLGIAAVWHRAEATVGRDEPLATELAALADQEPPGGRAVASLALERASVLTHDVRLGSTYLARAAALSFLAGDLPRTRSLAERVLAASPSDAVRGEVLLVLGTVEEYAGSVPRAAHLLAEAADLVHGEVAVRVLSQLANVRFRLGDVAAFAVCAQQLARTADLTDPYQRMLTLFAQGWAAALGGEMTSAAPALREALEIAASRRVTDPSTLMVYQAAHFTEDLPMFVALATARADELREDGLAGLLVSALAMLSSVRASLGDHDGAFADAGEAVDLAQHLGQVADAATAYEELAWQSAARGFHDHATDALAASSALLARAGLSTAAAHHALTAAFCALTRDDLQEVVATLEPRLGVDGGVGALGEPLGVAPLLVEALVGLGRHRQATVLTEELETATPPDGPPLLDAARLRCRALVATDHGQARTAFEHSIMAYEAASAAFEVCPCPPAVRRLAAPAGGPHPRTQPPGPGSTGVRRHAPGRLG